MAGAGQPFYMPLLWPVGHISRAVASRPDEAPTEYHASYKLDLIGHLTTFAAAARSIALAYIVYYHTPNPLLDGQAKEFHLDWMLPIVARNVAATWLICGFWDWLLYFSPLKDKFAPFKFNPKYPSKDQFIRDFTWSTSASITGALLEIAMYYLWANDIVPYCMSLADAPVTNALWLIFLTHWRVVHFWAIHRAMHPWRTTVVPDFGKLLYRYVHSLHHKSYNPNAFSGTSMHPVESTAYYSAGLVPFLFMPASCHPIVFLATVIDCAVGAWLGHDGFSWPGSGDYFHQLHHAHFECNYGAMHVPIDKWLGTYSDKPIPKEEKVH